LHIRHCLDSPEPGADRSAIREELFSLSDVTARRAAIHRGRRLAGGIYHVRFRDTEAFAHAQPTGGFVEVRRFGGTDDQRPTLVLANRSDIELARQVTAPGATWLDHRLVERQPIPLSMGGFRHEAATVPPPPTLEAMPRRRIVMNRRELVVCNVWEFGIVRVH
jgi:hypothetical protein